MNIIFTDKQINGLSNIPVSMSGLNIRVINALEEHGKESLYAAIEEILSGFNSIHGIGIKLIEESEKLTEQIIYRLNSFSPEDESDLDYRLVLFDGLSPDKEVRKVLEGLPISLLELSNRAFNTLKKKQVANIYEAIIEIKTAFQNTKGIGKKSIDDTIQVIDKTLLKIESVEPMLIEDQIDLRPNPLRGAEGNFLSVLKEIIDLYFENQERKNLKDRNKNIIEKRFNLDGNGHYSQSDIGIHYDISRQRIEQIESKILRNIEQLFLGELKTKGWRLDIRLIEGYIELKEILCSKDFIISHSELIIILTNLSHEKFNELHQSLLMKLLGYFKLPKSYVKFRGSIIESWCRADKFKPKEIESLFVALDAAHKSPDPINFFDLIVKVKKKTKNKFSNDEINIALKFCSEVEVNDDEVYIKPEYLKSTTDKAYVILLSYNDKMHYSEILRAINSSEHDKKTYKKYNLTNQLTSDDRFVAVGKSGYWGLKKWGTINNDSVIKAMENVLHKLSVPTTFTNIVKETKKIRPDAKQKSINIYLNNKKDIFTRVSKDKYALTDWKMQPYQGQKTQFRVSNSDFYEKAFEILKVQNPIPLASFVKQMMPITYLKEVTIRQRVNNSKFLKTRPITSRSKEVYCENLDNLKNQLEKKQNLTIREEIHARVLETLQTMEGAITKGELFKEISKNYTCAKPTFYRYLSEMSNVSHFRKNNKSLVELKESKQDFKKNKTVNELQKLRNDILSLSKDFAGLKVSFESKNLQIDEIYRLLDKESESADLLKYKSQVKSEFPKYAYLEKNSLTFLESSYFLFDKLNDIQDVDYSPYVLQYSRVVENEL